MDVIKHEDGLANTTAALLLKVTIVERPIDAPFPPRFHINQMAMFIAYSNALIADEDLVQPQQRHYHNMQTNMEQCLQFKQHSNSQQHNNAHTVELCLILQPLHDALIQTRIMTKTLRYVSTYGNHHDLDRYMQGYSGH